jgi:NADPH-dependent curcumin reductase CurA
VSDRQDQRHTVIGSAAGAGKRAFLEDIGADCVIDYKATSNLTEALLRAAPNGVDIYFDNVGGEHLERRFRQPTHSLASRFAG